MMNFKLFHFSTAYQFTAHAEVGSEAIEHPCTSCPFTKKERVFRKPWMNIVRAQKNWPDTIDCWEGDVFSERVINDLVDNNITGFEAFELTDVEVTPKNRKPPTPYYYLHATGRAQFLPIIPPDYPNPVCPVCGCWKYDYQFPNGVDMIHCPYTISNWDGQDIVDAQDGTSRIVCCSRRVIELARKKGWTNFRFIYPSNYVVSIYPTSPNWEELFLTKLKQDCMKRFPMLNLSLPDFLLHVPDPP